MWSSLLGLPNRSCRGFGGDASVLSLFTLTLLSNSSSHAATTTPVDLDGSDPPTVVLSAATSLGFCIPPGLTEHQAFTAIMEEIIVSPISTISHIPRSVRPLLAETLTSELRLACSGNVWGAVLLQLFAKTVLRAPPTNARKWHLVVASLISNRLRRWNSDKTAASGLWREALMENQQFHCDIGNTHSQVPCTSEIDSSNDNLTVSNAARALHWEHEGRYGNAIKSLESLGVAPPSDQFAWSELLKRHPQQALPPFDSDIPSALTVDSQDVLSVAFPGAPVQVALAFVPNTSLTQFVVPLHLQPQTVSML